MTEEMRTESMDIIVSGIEKHSESMELACKMIKETMDKKYGGPWHVRRVPTAPHPPSLPLYGPVSPVALTLRGVRAGRRGRGLRLHCAVRGEEPVLHVLRRDWATRRDSAVQVLCYISQT